MADFNAALEALSQVGMVNHATFKEVRAAYLEHGGANNSSSYQLRTVLRFLKQAKPVLINAIRDGYKVQSDDADEFKAGAHQAMDLLGPRNK